MKKPVQISNEEFKEKQYELSFLWWYDKKKPKQINLTLKDSIAGLHVASFHILLTRAFKETPLYWIACSNVKWRM